MGREQLGNPEWVYGGCVVHYAPIKPFIPCVDDKLTCKYEFTFHELPILEGKKIVTPIDYHLYRLDKDYVFVI